MKPFVISIFLSPIFQSSFCAALPLSDAETDAELQSRATGLVDCLNAANVPISLTSSADWSELNTPYNLRLSYTPAVITIPDTQEQVAASVTCAAASGVKVQAKSGGHSYASFSSGGRDGSLIVNLQNFQGIEVDTGKYSQYGEFHDLMAFSNWNCHSWWRRSTWKSCLWYLQPKPPCLAPRYMSRCWNWRSLHPRWIRSRFSRLGTGSRYNCRSGCYSGKWELGSRKHDRVS
jgi:hypothetical protein